VIFKNKNLLKLHLLAFSLVVFLIPSQLAFHLWPNWSLVFGIRVDYLAITIYLTDILVFAYILSFLITQRKNIVFDKKTLKTSLVVFLFSILNILFSFQKELALLKWLKIYELILFSFFVSKDQVITKRLLKKSLSLSICLFSFIGFLQIIRGSTSGRLFYFLGERNFTKSTPGISLLFFLDKTFLKPYSTFSHPNSLSGFLAVVLLLLTCWLQRNKDNITKFSIVFGGMLLFFCFSRSVILALFFVLILFFFLKKDTNKYLSLLKIVFGSLIFLSFLLPIFSNKVLEFDLGFSQNIKERLVLSKAAGQIFSTKPILGVGLNNFIRILPLTNVYKNPIWLLQPVHNVFLLLLSEVGVLGFVIFFALAILFFNSFKLGNKKEYVVCFILILITGFFDHYWLTLQQNLILLFLVLGLSKNKQIE